MSVRKQDANVPGSSQLSPGDGAGAVGSRIPLSAADGRPFPQVLASSTVRDLSPARVEFEDRGSHELKGVPGEWHLYAVSSA
jgi:class 3 adenylate cyclase